MKNFFLGVLFTYSSLLTYAVFSGPGIALQPISIEIQPIIVNPPSRSNSNIQPIPDPLFEPRASIDFYTIK